MLPLTGSVNHGAGLIRHQCAVLTVKCNSKLFLLSRTRVVCKIPLLARRTRRATMGILYTSTRAHLLMRYKLVDIKFVSFNEEIV